MAKCLECNGKAKKQGLYYVCEDCGVTTSLQEFARGRDKITKQKWQSEINGDRDDYRKKRRQDDMMKWYLKQSD